MGNKWQIFWTDIPLAILLLLFLNATCNFTPFDERTIHGYILFRRHHLRSINIPKFPNINRLSRSKSSRKDTDLAREGVVTCREHEKKSRSLSLSSSCKNLVLSSICLYTIITAVQGTIVSAHRDFDIFDREAKEANIPEGIARKRRIARSAILARRRREDLLLCPDSFAMKCDHPPLVDGLRQPAWKSFSTSRRNDGAEMMRFLLLPREDVPPSEIPPPLLPFFFANTTHRTWETSESRENVE